MTANAEAILKTVRTAVIEGQYDQLEALLSALQSAEAEIPVANIADLRVLKAEAERTEACLTSALNGVRAARRRVTEVTEATRGLTTYDRDGSRATVLAAIPTTRRV